MGRVSGVAYSIIDGKVVKIAIPPGTQSGRLFRLKKEGILTDEEAFPVVSMLLLLLAKKHLAQVKLKKLVRLLMQT